MTNGMVLFLNSYMQGKIIKIFLICDYLSLPDFPFFLVFCPKVFFFLQDNMMSNFDHWKPMVVINQLTVACMSYLINLWEKV